MCKLLNMRIRHLLNRNKTFMSLTCIPISINFGLAPRAGGASKNLLIAQYKITYEFLDFLQRVLTSRFIQSEKDKILQGEA